MAGLERGVSAPQDAYLRPEVRQASSVWARVGPAAELRELLSILGSLLENVIGRWTAAPMSAADRTLSQAPQDGPLRFVDIPADLHKIFYDTACVTGLGFLFHSLFDTTYTPLFDSDFRTAWDAYIEVNRRYAESVIQEELDGPVLVEDYHLMALAHQVRSINPAFGRTIAYFHHVPWCPPASIRVIARTPGGIVRAGNAAPECSGSAEQGRSHTGYLLQPELAAHPPSDRQPVVECSARGLLRAHGVAGPSQGYARPYLPSPGMRLA